MVDVGGAISLGGGGGGGGTVSDVASPDSSITITNPTGPTVDLILPAVGTAGTFGDNADYPVVTTDAKGRVSGVSLQPLASTPAITNVTWNLVRRSATATAGQTECTIFNGSTAAQTISLPTTGQSYRIINAATVPVLITSAVNSMFIENVLYAATNTYSVPVGMGITFTYDATGIWYAVSWDPLGATTVVGPDAYSSPAVVGSSLLYARADHDHGLPAAPAASLSSFAEHISSGVGPFLSTGWSTWIISVTSFQVGKYLVFLNGTVEAQTGSSGSKVGSGQVAGGTGTATSVAAPDVLGAGIGNYIATVGASTEHNAVLIVTVTAAGTLGFQFYYAVAGSGGVTQMLGSGFIAVKIA